MGIIGGRGRNHADTAFNKSRGNEKAKSAFGMKRLWK